MCPPHLVFKWAREVLVTIPHARTFVIYDLRNGGDPKRPHGVVEVKLRGGEIIHKGLKTTLYEMRTMGRDGWRRLCPWPAYFIVSRESGKLSYHWKPAFTVAASGPDRGAVTNPDTGPHHSRRGWRYDHPRRVRRRKAIRAVYPRQGRYQRILGAMAGGQRKIQRMAPLGYIGHFMKDWWDYAIADELHQLAQESAPGQQSRRPLSVCAEAHRTHGTLMGGYADDLFHLFYRMEAAAHGWRKALRQG